MGAVGVEQGARGVLCLLDVRLVKRIDVQQQSGGGGGRFPAEELGTECCQIRHVDGESRHVRGTLAKRAVRRVRLAAKREPHDDAIVATHHLIRPSGNRDDALALLARACVSIPISAAGTIPKNESAE